MIVRTPPMGFNTWNTFGEKISEDLIIETCDAMVEKGLRDAGYEYIVIDDCWSLRERDAEGRLQADPAKFPHGIKYLADYIHSKGMKLGMYSCVGPLTCAGYPGSLDHEFIDAKFFADNGVDYLKYDYCYHPLNIEGRTLYNRMKMALNATGRDIVFSLCNWGDDNLLDWARAVGGDLYRSTGDICDSFQSIMDIFKSQVDNFALSGPNCFNDMDMLVCGMNNVGNVSAGGCTFDEYKTHFCLWCMAQSPLMIGCDVRSVDDEMLALLKNPELIAINQDPGVRPIISAPLYDGDRCPAYAKHLENGEYAFSLTNLGDEEETVFLMLADIGLPLNGEWGFKLRDCDTGEEIDGVFEDTIKATVRSHSTRVFRGQLVKIR